MQSSDAHIGDKKPTQLDQRQIMEATRRCLQELGYEKTTIRKIAARLDCAVGSIYRYFKDKNQLLFAVAQESLVPVIDALELGERFTESVTRYTHVASRQCESYQLMFWLACVLLPEDKPLSLPPIVERVIDGWAVRLGDDKLANRAWSYVHGAVAQGQAPTEIATALDALMPLWRDAADEDAAQTAPHLRLAGEPVESASEQADSADAAADAPDLTFVARMTEPPLLPSMKLREGVTPPGANPQAQNADKASSEGEPEQPANTVPAATGDKAKGSDDVTLL